jgi:16S rRNA (guanine527-N7)-methyltransferase
MTSHEFETRLLDRVRAAGIMLGPDAVPKLEAYFRLLRRWNARINLTSLPLTDPSNATIDRLLVEPLVASGALNALPGEIWFDLGSGGGSPAVPIAIVRPELALSMVEVKEKKAAFLREVNRSLGLNATVEAKRFEELAGGPGAAALVTVRAVKPSAELWGTAAALLKNHGILAYFAGSVSFDEVDGFERLPVMPLTADKGSRLIRMRRVPRETSVH